MGRVNFNGIVISLQSIVLHGRGNLREWPLTTALHHSRPQQLPKGFFSPGFCGFDFFFNTCSPNVCSGLFRPLSHGSEWDERMLAPQDEVLAGISHIHPWPTTTGWDVFPTAAGGCHPLSDRVTEPNKPCPSTFHHPHQGTAPKTELGAQHGGFCRKTQEYNLIGPQHIFFGWLQGSKSQCAAPKNIWKLSQTTALW